MPGTEPPTSNDAPTPAEPPPARSPDRPLRQPGRWQLSLRQSMLAVLIVALVAGYAAMWHRLRQAETELSRLRAETGYLPPTEPGQIAAVRLFSDEVLTYRFRVRVPAEPRHRVVYSTVRPKGAASPHWFAGVDLPPGESVVTVRLGEDPRDERWKITASVRSPQGTKRVATALLPAHAAVFRRPSEAIRAGIGRDPQLAVATDTIRLLDERLQLGEGGMLLYGERAPEEDQIGVFAELQPDTRPL